VRALTLRRTQVASAETDYPRVALLSLGHLANDAYGSLISSLTPYLVLRGAISTTAAGLVLFIYLIGSSLLQPLIGVASDRTGRRLFAVLGPIWIGVAAGLTGWAGNALALLALAAVGGIGTAAFHPQAAAMVNRLSGRNRGFVMSIFSMGGNIGFALGPLVAAGIATVGLHWSPVTIVPGLAVTALLLRFAPDVRRAKAEEVPATMRSIPGRVWTALSLIVLVIALRSGVLYGLMLFLPLYYHAHGFSAQLGSAYAFLLTFSGALGGLAGGSLSDRYGRRPQVVLSLLISVPLVYASFAAVGPLVWLLMAASGAVLLSSNSVTVVQAQDLLPANTGMVSGLTMGLGFGLSGVVAFALGALADLVGVQTAIYVVPLLAPIAAAAAWLVPERGSRHLGVSRS
jgi:FSR family fosmidomycin resistance protein-like MFS transporter